MSFALTTAQVVAQTKTVTRRLGWTFLKPGDLIQPIVKGMGLKKGQSPEKIGGPIRVVAVERQRLDTLLTCYEMYANQDIRREGFDPAVMPRQAWVEMFCASHQGCTPASEVTRIEFEYTTGGGR